MHLSKRCQQCTTGRPNKNSLATHSLYDDLKSREQPGSRDEHWAQCTAYPNKSAARAVPGDLGEQLHRQFG